MEIDADISKTLDGFDRLSDNVENAIEYAISIVGTQAATEMAKLINGWHRPGTRTPSKSGEPPTNVTGTLRRSIKSVTKQGFDGNYVAIAGPTVQYARKLEEGWSNGVRYPFVEPTAKIMQENGRARNIYINALRYALEKQE